MQVRTSPEETLQNKTPRHLNLKLRIYCAGVCVCVSLSLIHSNRLAHTHKHAYTFTVTNLCAYTMSVSPSVARAILLCPQEPCVQGKCLFLRAYSKSPSCRARDNGTVTAAFKHSYTPLPTLPTHTHTPTHKRTASQHQH